MYAIFPKISQHMCKNVSKYVKNASKICPGGCGNNLVCYFGRQELASVSKKVAF